MSPWSYRFVALVFVALGASFIYSTVSIFNEFQGPERDAILAAHSYLFVFFPTLGIVALAAFYIPAVVFTDVYFTKAKLGWLRFTAGFVAAILLSLYFASDLNSTALRSVWELSPKALQTDARRGETCLNPGPGCAQPIMSVITDLREKALGRVRVSPFTRECTQDTLLEPKPELEVERYCFPAKAKLKAADCCRVQHAFADRVKGLWLDAANQSDASRLDLWLLPAKSFFIIIMVLIGVLLIGWKRTLQTHYRVYLRPMERGLQIGAVAMLLWPIMDYAYQQTSDILYGPSPSFPLRLSLVLVPWAMLLTFHFYARRLGIEPTRGIQAAGSVVSAIAVLRYDSLSDWSAKLVGLGASKVNFWVLVAASAVALIMLVWWIVRTLLSLPHSYREPWAPDDPGKPVT